MRPFRGKLRLQDSAPAQRERPAGNRESARTQGDPSTHAVKACVDGTGAAGYVTTENASRVSSSEQSLYATRRYTRARARLITRFSDERSHVPSRPHTPHGAHTTPTCQLSCGHRRCLRVAIRCAPRPSPPLTTPRRCPPCQSRRRGPDRPAQTGPPRRRPTRRRGRDPRRRSYRRRRH